MRTSAQGRCVILCCVVFFIVLMGVYPKMFFKKMDRSVEGYLQIVKAKNLREAWKATRRARPRRFGCPALTWRKSGSSRGAAFKGVLSRRRRYAWRAVGSRQAVNRGLNNEDRPGPFLISRWIHYRDRPCASSVSLVLLVAAVKERKGSPARHAGVLTLAGGTALAFYFAITPLGRDEPTSLTRSMWSTISAPSSSTYSSPSSFS